MDDTDLHKLEDSMERIWELARGMGLDPFPVHFEMVPASFRRTHEDQELWERAFRGGLPDLSIDDLRTAPPNPRRQRRRFGRRRPPQSPITPRTP